MRRCSLFIFSHCQHPRATAVCCYETCLFHTINWYLYTRRHLPSFIHDCLFYESRCASFGVKVLDASSIKVSRKTHHLQGVLGQHCSTHTGKLGISWHNYSSSSQLTFGCVFKVIGWRMHVNTMPNAACKHQLAKGRRGAIIKGPIGYIHKDRGRGLFRSHGLYMQKSNTIPLPPPYSSPHPHPITLDLFPGMTIFDSYYYGWASSSGYTTVYIRNCIEFPWTNEKDGGGEKNCHC